MRPAEGYIFVEPTLPLQGEIKDVPIAGDPCRIGNEVLYDDPKPIELKWLGWQAIKEEYIVTEVAK